MDTAATLRVTHEDETWDTTFASLRASNIDDDEWAPGGRCESAIAALAVGESVDVGDIGAFVVVRVS